MVMGIGCKRASHGIAGLTMENKYIQLLAPCLWINTSTSDMLKFLIAHCFV